MVIQRVFKNGYFPLFVIYLCLFSVYFLFLKDHEDCVPHVYLNLRTTCLLKINFILWALLCFKHFGNCLTLCFQRNVIHKTWCNKLISRKCYLKIFSIERFFLNLQILLPDVYTGLQMPEHHSYKTILEHCIVSLLSILFFVLQSNIIKYMQWGRLFK